MSSSRLRSLGEGPVTGPPPGGVGAFGAFSAGSWLILGCFLGEEDRFLELASDLFAPIQQGFRAHFLKGLVHFDLEDLKVLVKLTWDDDCGTEHLIFDLPGHGGDYTQG